LTNKDGLANRPSEKGRMALARDVIANPKLFSNRDTGFINAKNTLSWLDPITYEDFRVLNKNSQFTLNNVASALL
jgi:hypothetical protein